MIPYEPHPILVNLPNPLRLFLPHVGDIAIRYYSLAYLIGFLLTYYWLRRKYGAQRAEDAVLYVALATIVGGRLGEFIFYSPQTFWTDPLEILKIYHGGMSFHGAFIALCATLYWYTKKHRISFLEFSDTVIIPATAGIILGRIANFLNGELVGTQTSVPWCMEFPGYSGCRHPSQLYEAIYTLITLGVLLLVYRKGKKTVFTPGFLTVIFITLYGVLRLLANFLRDDPTFFALSTGQWLSLCMALIGAYLLGTNYKKSLTKLFQ